MFMIYCVSGVTSAADLLPNPLNADEVLPPEFPYSFLLGSFHFADDSDLGQMTRAFTAYLLAQVCFDQCKIFTNMCNARSCYFTFKI